MRIDDEIIAELETAKILLDQDPPKVRNASFILSKIGTTEVEEIRRLLDRNPPRSKWASWELSNLIKRLSLNKPENTKNRG